MAQIALPPLTFESPPAITRKSEQFDQEIHPSVIITPTIHTSTDVSITAPIPPSLSAASVQSKQNTIIECSDDVPGWQPWNPETLTDADFEKAINYQLQAYLSYVETRTEIAPPNSCNPMHSDSKEPFKTIMLDRLVTTAAKIRNQAEVAELLSGGPLAWDYVFVRKTPWTDGTLVDEYIVRMNQTDLSKLGLMNGFILFLSEKNGSIKGITATQTPNTIATVGWDQLIGEKQTVNMLRVEYGEFGTGLPDDPSIAFPVLKIYINSADANVQFDLLTAFRINVSSAGSGTIIPDAYLMDPNLKSLQDWFWQFIPSVISGVIVYGDMAASLKNLRKAGYQFVSDKGGIRLINTRERKRRSNRRHQI